MAMTIHSNLTSIALSAFDKSVAMIGKALSHVAKGQKIVSASEDASQYALSERMQHMVRDLNRSSENIQNDSTMLKIADGAVSSTIDIVRHMREKAVQASDVNLTDAERRSMQKEFDALIDQVNVNASVQFNGRNLLDGSSSPLYSNKYSKNDMIIRGLNSEWIKSSLDLIDRTYGLSFQSSTATARKMEIFLDDDSAGDSPVSANLSETKANTIELHINTNYYDGNSFRNANGMSTEEGGILFDRQILRGMTEAVLLSNIPEYEQLDADIREGMIKLIDGTDDEESTPTGVTMLRYMASKSYRPVDEFIHEFARGLSEGWAKNGSLDKLISHSTQGVLTSFSAVQSKVGELSDENMFNETGITGDTEDIGAITGSDAWRLGAGKNTYEALRETSTPADWRQPSRDTSLINGLEVYWDKQYIANDGGGGLTFQIGTNAYDKMNVGLFNMSARGLGLTDDTGKNLQITTQGNAMEAAAFLDTLVNTLLQHSADIGAIQQRVQFTTNNLERSSDNIQAAESTIRDADMAREMVDLNRSKALNQASQSVLAQSNQNSEKVLQVMSNESGPIEVHANTIQAKRVYDDNLSEVGKDLKQISSGEKVTDPTDGSSPYQIGEAMRAKLRVLEQDSDNVQTGSSILKTAQKTVDAMVEDIKMLKELALNAANGHNTDNDRLVLQKTFDQIRDNLDDLASTATYNGNQLLDGRYQRFHKQFNVETNRAVIGEALGLTVHHGADAGQSVRFYIDNMHTNRLGGVNVGKGDLDDLLNNKDFTDSRNTAELEQLTELQTQLQQLREDSSVLKRDENLRESLQGLVTEFGEELENENAEVSINHAVMREYLDVESLGVDRVVENLDRYEFLKPMVEEELVLDGLTTRLDEEGNEIEVEEFDEEGAAITGDIEAVEILKDSAGKTLDDLQLNTIHNANVAMKVVSSALDTILNESAKLGASVARLEFTSQNISAQIENTENMDSTIRDADMAKSMSKYMKDQMLTNASQTMLSHAIHDPIMVLSFNQ